MNYEPPYTYEEILKNYGKDIAEKLSKDPVHAWRMSMDYDLEIDLKFLECVEYNIKMLLIRK